MKVATSAIAGQLSLEPGEISDAIESSKKAVAEGGGKLTEKTLQKLLDGYTKTQQLQEDFEQSLSAMTAELEHPFVVIIDELDRCRPSFALEVLERIKHLFSADKVVFVLFWNSESIHESIRHTYGRNTQAESYLAKFVSLTIPLDLPARAQLGPERAYAGFINQEISRVLGINFEGEEFQEALASFAVIFNASLRDVQRSISILRVLIASNKQWPATELAYLLLVSLLHPTIFRGILRGEQRAIDDALAQLPLPNPDNHVNPVGRIWISLKYRLEPAKYQEMAAKNESGINEMDDLIVAELKRRGFHPSWMDDAAKAIRSALATYKTN